MSVIIRDACISDAPRLLEIYSYYVQHTAISFEYTTPTQEEFCRRMRRIMSRYPYLVAEVDGTVQGYAYAGAFVGRAAYDWSCELTIYLARDARKMGLGRQLYTALEQRLAQMGVLNLYACIGWPEAEDEYLTRNSAQFHEHLGFTLAGTFRRCGYKFGRWYDMVWMEKLLAPHRPPAASHYSLSGPAPRRKRVRERNKKPAVPCTAGFC